MLLKIGPKHWQRYGLETWIEAAKKRLHHNVLAIALANKLARIAWAVLHKGRAFECAKSDAMARPSVLDPRAVLAAVKAWPASAGARGKAGATPALTAPARGASRSSAGRDEGTAAQAQTKERREARRASMT